MHPQIRRHVALLCMLWGVAPLSGLQRLQAQATGDAGSPPPSRSGPTTATDAGSGTRGARPDWTADARWYYIVVPRFCNGDRDNDPPDTKPWSFEWPTAPAGPKADPAALEKLETETREYRFGGDLRGVIKRLPYLKELGVNALCLSPVFHGSSELQLGQVDLRHIDPWVGAKGSLAEAADERSDPATWIWTSSDKLMLELIREAHANQMRVVASGLFRAVSTANNPPSELEAYYLAATRRWMDPDGDGRPDDGIDGWFLSFEEGPLKPFGAKESAFWERWRAELRRINPQAVVIGSGPLAVTQTGRGLYDLAFNEPLAASIRSFFATAGKRPSAGELLDAVEKGRAKGVDQPLHENLLFVSVAGHGPRLLTALSAPHRVAPVWRGDAPGPPPSDEGQARWRLATIFQHFAVGAPATYYGDETGMYGGSGIFASPPMWWAAWTDAPEHSTLYRDDFFALVQWLHRMRQWYAPLRQGDFRRVLVDEENRILAFSRSLPDDEVILVMNYGDAKQKVMLPVGRPGRLVGVFSPQIQPEEKTGRRTRDKAAPTDAKRGKPEPLGVGGSRQFVNDEGRIRLWVAPMSIRVVFVAQKEPRR